MLVALLVVDFVASTYVTGHGTARESGAAD